MSDFCKSCTDRLFGSDAAKTLDYGCKEDEATSLLCEGCGKMVWVRRDGLRVDCSTCGLVGDEICEYPEDSAGEIGDDYVCGHWKERK